MKPLAQQLYKSHFSIKGDVEKATKFLDQCASFC